MSKLSAGERKENSRTATGAPDVEAPVEVSGAGEVTESILISVTKNK